MKHWILPKNKYIALCTVIILLVVIGVLFIPAFSAKPYENLAKIIQTYFNHFDFINIFVAVTVIVFISASGVMIILNLLLFLGVIKFKVISIACYCVAGIILVLFVMSLVYTIGTDNIVLGASGYLLWLWIAVYISFGTFVRPDR